MGHTQLQVGNKYFQPEASIHTYGALATTILSKTYSGVYQMNQPKPGKSTMGMMLLSLLRDYEENTGLCFDCSEDGDLHIPSQPTCSHFFLWIEVPG